jgi:hypothetical protein
MTIELTREEVTLLRAACLTHRFHARIDGASNIDHVLAIEKMMNKLSEALFTLDHPENDQTKEIR